MGTEEEKEKKYSGPFGISSRERIKLGVVAAALIFAVAGAFPAFINTCKRPDYTHAPLVPLISAYLVWLKRDRLRGLALKPAPILGGLLLVCGGLMLVLSKASDVVVTQLFAVIPMVAGVVLLLGGGKWLRALALPIGYLIFMVPVLDLFVKKISLPFQVFSAGLGSRIIALTGLPVYHTKQYIELPGMTLEVAEECSGLRFLISILAVSIPLSIIMLKENWKRAVLVLTAVAVAFLANPLRVGLVGIWGYYINRQFVHGPLHILTGIFVSLVGYLFLFGCAMALARGRRRKGKNRAFPAPAGAGPQQGEKPEGPFSGNATPFVIDNKALAVAAVILVLTGFARFGLGFLAVKTGPAHPLGSVPQDIGRWRGTGLPVGQVEFRAQAPDEELARVYDGKRNGKGKIKSPGGGRLELYVAYYARQSEKKKMIYYTLAGLYNVSKTVRIGDGGRSVRVNEATMANYPFGGTQVLYWYDVGGRIFANNYLTKFYCAVRAIGSGRTNGALVMVLGRYDGRTPPSALAARERSFAKAVLPAVDRTLYR